MYSGTTLFRRFDAWFGAHQKIDRVARRHLSEMLGDEAANFPSIKQILRFEGLDGPDGIKRKAPANDEPWHYYDPHDATDFKLKAIIQNHYDELVQALRTRNEVRAAFEAAWLAHAIVDGLTPAHHYPYEKELVKLRGGDGIETRTTVRKKLVMPGETLIKKLSNNWKMWGDKGLLATHFAFEWGVAAVIAPMHFKQARPSEADTHVVLQQGVVHLFHERAAQVEALHMYDMFYTSGWTPQLAAQTRRELAPLIVSTVNLAWYSAAVAAKTPVSAV